MKHLLSFVCLLLAFSIGVRAAPVETRACEIRLENSWTLQQVRDAVNRMGDMGINCVRVETFYHGTTIYNSAVMTKWGLPATRPGFTPGPSALAEVIKTAHARNMTVYAWVETFYVWNSVLGPGMGSILTKYPDWSIRSLDGTPLPKNAETSMYYISPANLTARQFLKELYAEIANTGVDGLFVDYLRYPRGSLGPTNALSYDDASKQRALAELGLDITTIPLSTKNADFKTWTSWREQQTTDAAKELALAAADANPNVVFCGTVHPHFNPDWRTRDSLRSWPAWWPEVRAWSMQYYTGSNPPSATDVQGRINDMTVDLNAANPSAALWPAVKTSDISTGMPLLNAARAQPNIGVSYWVYSSLLDSDGPLLLSGPFSQVSDQSETMPIRGARNLIQGVLPNLPTTHQLTAQSALNRLTGSLMHAGLAQTDIAPLLTAGDITSSAKRDLGLAHRLLSLAPNTLVSGDADRDGVVTLRDPIAVLRWQLGGPAISRDAADLSDDGRVSLSDAIGILWIAAGLK